MVTPQRPYSIIVPVRNEAARLHRTLPALLAAAGPGAEIICVCNGCSDGSADLARTLGGGRVRVIETDRAGKTVAFNLGDAAARHFPRFYVDADVLLAPGALDQLAGVLHRGAADMVSPALRFDMTGATPVARAMARIWMGLPHGRQSTFQAVIGLSERARQRWGAFPDILGDDIFIRAKVAPLAGRVEPTIVAVTGAPPDFWAWVRVRARWRRGERQLARMGLVLERAQGQGRGLLALFLSPETAPGAVAYALARVLAVPLSLWQGGHAWRGGGSS